MANSNSYNQEQYIEGMIKNHTPVSVIMVNGFQMRGIIVSNDTEVMFVTAEGKTQMVYKHAISTIAPIRLDKQS